MLFSKTLTFVSSQIIIIIIQTVATLSHVQTSCFGRKGLWYVWGFNAVIASIFSIVAVSHGAVLDKIIVNNKAANSILDAAIAGITCAVFLNICYLIVTSLILLRKTLALNGAGATYGFMVAMSLMMFFNQVQVRHVSTFARTRDGDGVGIEDLSITP